MIEQKWERKLHIHTTGREENDATDQIFPYEPTPYAVLERLVSEEWISSQDHVLDYGCGKGRVCIFLAMTTGCRATGVDVSEKLLKAARKNWEATPGKDRVEFLQCPAERYALRDENRIFFFNPFSEKILHSVLGQIRKSQKTSPRDIKLFFYYPSDEFVSCLMTAPDLMFIDEIDCSDLFDGDNSREKILIFSE